ncbi:MAG TPA: 5-oxoprolinase subunit PxpB [Jatrophihabitans sp.]|jgi:KipI family sensor histidine kinase inhibitor|nr:5-oxoprolinase subunit PxpB [Jatrophihabitans sp.]
MIDFTVLPYGDSAVLLELAEPTEVLALRDGLLAQRDPAIRAVVPAARTVLVEFDPARTDPARIATSAQSLSGQTSDESAADLVRLPVRYDGADLAEVAEHCGLSVPELVELHSKCEYTVRFCGFSPGFGYLTGLDDRLRLPRLTTPRTQVPAGSVAIADEYTGVYPRSSPGGWRLLGQTSTTLFDLDRDPPALLAPGTRVRFVPQ